MASEKIYDVPVEWSSRAFVDQQKYREMYQRSVDDPSGFWGEQGLRLEWMRPYTKVKNTSFGTPEAPDVGHNSDSLADSSPVICRSAQISHRAATSLVC